MGCSSFLYYPSDKRYIDPNKLGVSPEEVWFEGGEGRRLHGWYFSGNKTSGPKAVLIFFHGNAENISSHFVTLAWILNHGYDYFIFDYSGYGQSEGGPSPENTTEDGKRAIRWIDGRWSKEKVPLVVFGQSLGGAIALRCMIELEDEIPVQLIVVDSAFHSYRAVAKRVLAQHWLTWIWQPFVHILLSDKYAPGEAVAKISPIPIIFIHGTADRTVPFELGVELYELAQPPKEFWRIEGGNHTDALWRHNFIYRELLLERLAAISKD